MHLDCLRHQHLSAHLFSVVVAVFVVYYVTLTTCKLICTVRLTDVRHALWWLEEYNYQSYTFLLTCSLCVFIWIPCYLHNWSMLANLITWNLIQYKHITVPGDELPEEHLSTCLFSVYYWSSNYVSATLTIILTSWKLTWTVWLTYKILIDNILGWQMPKFRIVCLAVAQYVNQL